LKNFLHFKRQTALGEKGAIAISNQIKHLCNLIHLKLQLKYEIVTLLIENRCNRIGEIGAIAVADCFKNMGSILELYLNLGYENFIKLINKKEKIQLAI